MTDFIISAWTRVQTFLSSFWNSASIQFDQFIRKISDVGICDTFIKTWIKIKSFFINIFDSIQKKWSSLVAGFKNVSNFSGIKLPKIGNLFASGTSKLSEKVSEIRKISTPTTRNQSNNFSITINGAKNEDAESLSQKVMNKVSAFSKTFLYDEATEVA